MHSYSRQSINSDDKNAVLKALGEDILTGGNSCEEFEKSLAKYVGAKYAVSFSSGTASLHAAYLAAGLGNGDEFITSPMSFCATSNAGLFCGAKPIFCDVDPHGQIDTAKIQDLISPKTRAIVPVDYAGNPCDIKRIMDLAKKHSLIVIEDASHALATQLEDGSKIGSIADLTTFSFHPVKPITTLEGGAVTTNSEELFKKLLLFRSHGIIKGKRWEQDMVALGNNYRLSAPACALGLSQLNRLDEFIEKRQNVAKIYEAGLGEFASAISSKAQRLSRHLFAILLHKPSQKKALFDFLLKKGVGVQVHYKPITQMSFYRQMGYEDLEGANRFYEQELSIPCHQNMDESEAKKVLQILNEGFLHAS